MWNFFIVLVFVIISGVVFIIKITKMNRQIIKIDKQLKKDDLKTKPKQSIFSKIFSKKKKEEPEINVEAEPVKKEPDVEVLELFPNEKDIQNIEPVKDDVLNLDDLFKTISLSSLNDDPDFDFGLRRSDKK